jgi:hypothetical protein
MLSELTKNDGFVTGEEVRPPDNGVKRRKSRRMSGAGADVLVAMSGDIDVAA